MGAVLEKRLSEVGVEAWRKPGFAVFASSPGVRTLTKANFKLAVIYNQLLKTLKIQELAITPLDFASIYFCTSGAAVEHKQ